MEDPECETFGALLRRLRGARGWTQEALAARAQVSTQAVSTLERGRRRLPWPTTVARLADALTLSKEERQYFTALARSHGLASDAAQGPSVLHLVAPAPPTNLPKDATRFIGREREIKAVTGLLRDPFTCLITLTGSGGTGKTRLAIEVGRSLRHDYGDGVYLVSLASLAEPQLVMPAVAHVLGVRQAGTTDWVQTLIGHLYGKQLLLILDNFEHVLDAACDAGRLLEACPGVTVLATSRAALHIYAARLFVDRVRATDPGFDVTPDNIASIVEICTRVDGLPLAIELAVGRVQLYGTDDLAARLVHRLPLLIGGSKDLPQRQHTLRATIDWSYNLLPAAEQHLLARLSMFAGGCALEAIEAVCAPEAEFDIVNTLATLVEHHFVEKRASDQESRFVMLDTIREYAAQLLERNAEAAETRCLHARYYFSLVGRIAAQMHTPIPTRAPLERLDRDLDNLRLAFAWLVEHDAESALRLCRNLVAF